MNNETSVSIKFTNKVTGEKKLERYATQLKTIYSALSSIDTGKAKILEGSMNKVTDDKTKNKVDKLGNSLSLAFSTAKLTAFLTTINRVTKKMSEFTKKTATYTENMNLLDVAFNNNTDEAEKFVNTLSEMYGLDESWGYKTVGIFKQLANAMGLADEVGTKMSKTLTQLAIDTSSLYNIEVEDTVSILQSALAGQTKPARRLGADITQSTLQLTLNSAGIDRTIESLSYAEKRLVIVASLLNQTQNSFGDWGRTIDGVAQQMRIFQQQTERLTRAIGSLFLPILKATLPFINAFLMVLTEIINWLAVLVGYDPKEFDFFSGTSESVLDLSEGLSSANENAKKLKSGLRGFDKLNNITTPSSGGGASASGGASGIDPEVLNLFNKASDGYLKSLEKIENKATKIRDKIMKWLGFTKLTNKETGDVSFKYDGIKKTLTNFYNSFMKLNTVGKIFVALGLALVFKKIFDIVKKATTIFRPFYGIIDKMITPLKNIVKYIKEYVRYAPNLNSAIKTATSDWSSQASALEKMKLGLVGVTTALVGISFMADAFKSISENGFNFNNVMTLILGSLTLAGGAIITLTALLGSMSLALAGATAGISVIVGAVVALVAGMANAKKTTNEYVESMNEINNSAKANADASIGQINRTKELTSELGLLVSRNGEVKKSDEDRVNYILTKVNEAYGTEYQLIDNKIYKNGQEIKSNEDLIKSIDEVMRKKRAEAILNAYQDVYNEALRQQNEILKEAEGLSSKKGELSKKEKKQLQELKDQYDENQKTIKNYEKLEEVYLTGTIEKIDKATRKFYDDTQATYNRAFDGLKKESERTRNYCENNLGSFETKFKVDASEFNSFANQFNNSDWQKTTNHYLPPFSLPRHKTGLPFVPNDYYLAYLDYGERVLTKEQNADYNRGIINGQNAISGSPVNATFVIKVGDKELAKQVINNIQDMAKNNGKPITIGGF